MDCHCPSTTDCRAKAPRRHSLGRAEFGMVQAPCGLSHDPGPRAPLFTRGAVNQRRQLTRPRRFRRGSGSGGRTQLPQFGSTPRDGKRTESAAGMSAPTWQRNLHAPRATRTPSGTPPTQPPLPALDATSSAFPTQKPRSAPPYCRPDAVCPPPKRQAAAGRSSRRLGVWRSPALSTPVSRCFRGRTRHSPCTTLLELANGERGASAWGHRAQLPVFKGFASVVLVAASRSDFGPFDR